MPQAPHEESIDVNQSNKMGDQILTPIMEEPQMAHEFEQQAYENSWKKLDKLTQKISLEEYLKSSSSIEHRQKSLYISDD